MALLTVTFIMMIQFIYTLMELVLQPVVTMGQVFGVIGTLLPSLVIFAMPMAILIGVMIGVGRMALDREITALRASGVNLWQVFAPGVALALGVSLLILGLSGAYVPHMLQRGMERIDKLTFVVINSLEPGRIHESFGGADGTNVYFNDRDPETHELKGVTIKLEGALPGQADDKKKEKKKKKTKPSAPVQASFAGRTITPPPEDSITMIFAETGVLTAESMAPDDNGAQDNAISLTLSNGSIHRLTPDPEKRDYIIGRFDSLSWVLHKAQSKKTIHKNRTNTELNAYIANPENKESKRGEARRELIERRTIAFASFVFALLGIPLAIMLRPSGKSWGILIAVGLMLVYYVAMQMGLAMVESNKPLGVLIAFLPNILYLGLGAGLWWRTLRS